MNVILLPRAKRLQNWQFKRIATKRLRIKPNVIEYALGKNPALSPPTEAIAGGDICIVEARRLAHTHFVDNKPTFCGVTIYHDLARMDKVNKKILG
jgi:hypothetical protein